MAVFVAAGNDRNDEPPSQPIQHWALKPAMGGGLEFKLVSDEHHPDGHDQGGYDTIAGLGLSKNAICIGAVFDIPTSLSPIESTPFSSWGPSDDGRIKPDLVANGQQLYSTGIADDAAYTNSSGTSMASPVACGCGALIAEYYQARTGNSMPAATLKAVLVHTARDAGAAGPDYVYGWGAIDTFAAGRVVQGEDGQQIRHETVNKNQQRTFTMHPAPSPGPIRVTVVWHDPAAPANTGNLDDPMLTLQNDVNIQLIAPDGDTYHPYVLDPANPTGPATTGDNQRDNVEMIDAPTRAGDWTLKLIGTDFAVGDSQQVSLVITGLVQD